VATIKHAMFKRIWRFFMQDDSRQRHARETAAPMSPRPSMTPEHSPKRWPRCRNRACRRHRRCVIPAAWCANKRWPLPRTDAQQDAALARIDRLTRALLQRRGTRA